MLIPHIARKRKKELLMEMEAFHEMNAGELRSLRWFKSWNMRGASFESWNPGLTKGIPTTVTVN